MYLATIIIVSFGFATKLAAAHPTAVADESDPMPIGDSSGNARFRIIAGGGPLP